MFFDEETCYWQEQYRKGDINDDDLCGETIAMLDGTAIKMILPALIFTTIIIAICYHYFG